LHAEPPINVKGNHGFHTPRKFLGRGNFAIEIPAALRRRDKVSSPPHLYLAGMSDLAKRECRQTRQPI